MLCRVLLKVLIGLISAVEWEVRKKVNTPSKDVNPSWNIGLNYILKVEAFLSAYVTQCRSLY